MDDMIILKVWYYIIGFVSVGYGIYSWNKTVNRQNDFLLIKNERAAISLSIVEIILGLLQMVYHNLDTICVPIIGIQYLYRNILFYRKHEITIQSSYFKTKFTDYSLSICGIIYPLIKYLWKV